MVSIQITIQKSGADFVTESVDIKVDGKKKHLSSILNECISKLPIIQRKLREK